MTLAIEPVESKRRQAFLRIAKNVTGTTLAGTVPTPALETTKMLGIALADAWMFWDVYRIYFDETLTAQKLRDMLGTAGIVVFTGGAFSYGVLRISQAMLGEFLNALPLVGWVVNGAIVGSSSLMLGLAWTAFVEERYRSETKAIESSPKPAISDKKQKVQITLTEEPEPQTSVVNGNGKALIKETAPADITVAPPKDIQPIQEQPKVVIEDDAPSAQPEKILTLHPEGKQGVEIDKDKYDTIRQAILDVLNKQEDILFKELVQQVETAIGDTFDGSVRWYVTTVKLDLEARHIIERVPDSSPQRLRLL
ncbi:MAG: hypothetical protein Kow00117_15400 [Phototrophicales bacterium]